MRVREFSILVPPAPDTPHCNVGKANSGAFQIDLRHVHINFQCPTQRRGEKIYDSQILYSARILSQVYRQKK